MKLKEISIRTKLLLLLLAFTFVTVVLLFLQTFYENSKLRIYGLTEELSQIEIGVLNAIQAQKDFIIHEPINANFFETGDSHILDKHDSIVSGVEFELDQTLNHPWIQSFGMENELYDLKRSLNRVTETFHELVKEIWIRGYKDYGLEGEMRIYAHRLEDEYGKDVDQTDILMLRRHEKDFIIRRQEKYILKFDYQIELIRYKLLLNAEISKNRKSEIEKLLQDYQNVFNKLVDSERVIGLKASKGLKTKVDYNTQQFTEEIRLLKVKVAMAQENVLARLRLYYGIGFVIFIGVAVYGSMRISKSMTSRIKLLTKNLNKFVESDFKEREDTGRDMGTDEVGELARNFKVMEEEIAIHFNRYKEKVERRTREILSQKEELERKQGIIEGKNKDILDSIKYAKKIQDSILPEKKYLDQLLNDYFVLHQPKDIVSGDFYWVERHQEKVFIAVADCTGHGVPGAFMSIMGNNFLNQAVNEKKITRPDQILNYINVAVSSSLGQNQSDRQEADLLVKVEDGMDIALLSIDFSKNELMFSGAQRPLIIVRKGQLIEIKGDRFPVGGSTYGEVRRFSLQTIQLHSDDNVYIFSDGYGDQFGGDRNKKFKYSKLRELFVSMRNDSPKMQKKILIESLQMWKGEKEQVDDICIFGLRI